MKFLKQLLFPLILVSSVPCVTLGIGSFNEKSNVSSNKQNIRSIMKVIGRAIESELAFVDANCQMAYKESELVNIDLDQAEQFYQQRLPILVAKVSNAIKFELTKKQQTIVINLLHNLNILSTFTFDDLMKIAEGCSTYAKRKAFEGALKKYESDYYLKNSKVTDLTQEEKILRMREIEKIDLHNEVFNLQKKFMCYCSYLDDISSTMDIDLGNDNAALSFQRCCYCLGLAIAMPSVVFQDFYFFPGWDENFEKVAKIFCVINKVSSALLKEIEQQ